jgi:hypothetical protein
VNDQDAIEAAWGIIANAGGGDWTKETPEWQEAAARWRDTVLPDLSARLAEAKQPSRWAIEYAIERLTDAGIFDQGPGFVAPEIADVLHGALTGKPVGLSAVSSTCPMCGATGAEAHRG